MKTDVVIIGAGIVGCSAAYYLAKHGRQVIVVEKDVGPGLQASGRSAGGVRQQGRRGALPLAIEGIQLWAGLTEALNADLQYRQTGNLVVSLDEEQTATLVQKTAWEQDHGLTDVRMLSKAECHDMIPGLTDQVVAGKLCPSDGSANPMLVPPAFARAAQKHAAQFQFGTTVESLLIDGSHVAGVRTDSGEIQAEIVINAAGPWANAFNTSVGCQTPIRPGRSQLLITEKIPPILGPFFSAMGRGYLLQAAAGNIIIGISGVTNENYEQYMDFPSIQAAAAKEIEVLDWLSDLRMIRSHAGITEYTPDGEPYIGEIPGITGLLVAAGFHGQGFCVGPMAGKILADKIEGQESPVSLAPFRVDRFCSEDADFELAESASVQDPDRH